MSFVNDFARFILPHCQKYGENPPSYNVVVRAFDLMVENFCAATEVAIEADFYFVVLSKIHFDRLLPLDVSVTTQTVSDDRHFGRKSLRDKSSLRINLMKGMSS
jgi:hypothetical protein